MNYIKYNFSFSTIFCNKWFNMKNAQIINKDDNYNRNETQHIKNSKKKFSIISNCPWIIPFILSHKWTMFLLSYINSFQIICFVKNLTWPWVMQPPVWCPPERYWCPDRIDYLAMSDAASSLMSSWEILVPR